jgi:alkylhydroperoxidase/carboxymuconolactone decarboxylase family protein YurZ
MLARSTAGRSERFTSVRRAIPGATVEEIRQVLMQVAIYAGFPAANAAFRVLEHEL